MRRKAIMGLCVFALIFGLFIAPPTARAAEGDGFYYIGSGLLSLLYFPIKLTTCVGTQAVSALAYVSTYQVPGSFEEGTNGREIGEVARQACAVPWLISPDQVKEDYQ